MPVRVQDSLERTQEQRLVVDKQNRPRELRASHALHRFRHARFIGAGARALEAQSPFPTVRSPPARF